MAYCGVVLVRRGTARGGEVQDTVAVVRRREEAGGVPLDKHALTGTSSFRKYVPVCFRCRPFRKYVQLHRVGGRQGEGGGGAFSMRLVSLPPPCSPVAFLSENNVFGSERDLCSLE